jgi:hypothetical protein
MKHRVLIPIESLLQGVNRHNLKFTNLHTIQARVSVRTKIKSGREVENKSNENQANEHGDLFYRGSVPKNLVPVEEVTKTGSIPTLSLSQTVN